MLLGRRHCAAAASVVAIAVAACGGSSKRVEPQLPDIVGEPYEGALKFDWPAGCSVPVAEVVKKSGDTAELTYRLRIDDTGTEKEISFTEMSIERVNGHEPPDVASVLAGFRLPSIRVDAAGAFVRVEGMDDLIEELVADEPGIAEMFTPEFTALVADSVGSKYWDSWVGFWSDLGEIDAEGIEATEVQIDVGEASYDTTISVESLGTTADGDAVLRQTQVLGGEDFIRALGSALSLAADLPSDEITSGGVTGTRRIVSEIATDPTTLRPRFASFTMDIAIKRNGGTSSQTERRRWSFDWAATRCGAA